MKTHVLLDHEPVADGGFFVRALLRIEGDAPTDERRVPLNLSLVLDRSGSMAGEPLAAAIDAATLLVRRLRMEDTVSVVAYDDDVHVVAPPATGEAQEDLVQRLSGIEVGGMTNLSGGWLRGCELVTQNRREGGVNRVVLLTDGQANVGITDRTRLAALTRSGAGGGVSTTTIGFGPHFDEDLLRTMADAGQGGTYYIEKIDQATGVFEEELEGLLSLAAQNIRVAVRPGKDADFVRVVHDYPNHAEGDVLTVEVGDLYAREPRRVLMEFLVGPQEANAGEADAPARDGSAPDAPTADRALAEVAELTVTAQVLTDGGGVELHTIALPITVSTAEGSKVEPTVRKEILLLEAARARRDALEARERGDWALGSASLRGQIASMLGMAASDPQIAEEVRDLESTAYLYDIGQVDAADIKYMKQRYHSTHRSRDSERERYRRTKDEEG